MSRIERAIDVLLDAVNNRTLAKGTCRACAVGNLVASAKGGLVEKTINYYPSEKRMILDFQCDVENDSWKYYFCTSSLGQEVHFNFGKETNFETEFTIRELAKIEKAFENNTKILYINYYKHPDSEILADQIKGLTAVIEVMKTFEPNQIDIKSQFLDKVRKSDLAIV